MRFGDSDFDDVGDFHEKFGLDNVTHHGAGQRDVDESLMNFRIKFMREELDEFEGAYEIGDEAGMFDALMDLVYVAMGTAHLKGYPWHSGWAEVQRANMAKVRAASDGRDSKRSSPWDVVKPPGWTPPDVQGVLLRTGTCRQCQRDLSKVNLREVTASSTSRVDIHCPCGAYIGSRAV